MRWVFLGLVMGVVSGPVLAGEPVRMGTATAGGGFQVYGDAFVEVVKKVDPGIEIELRATKGSAENIPLLEAGGLDIALVQGESAYEAFNGIGRPKADLRILSVVYPSPGMFVVKAGSAAKTIADLKGTKVAFGAAGSGLVTLARYVLDGIGLDQKADFDAVLLERAGDGPAMVADGRVAALWGGGIGWPGFRAVASLPGGARFIVPSSDEIARIQAKYPFLKTLVVPANTYPGQTEPLTSVGSWSFMLVRPGLDEAIVYRLAKALHQGEAALAKRLPAAADTTAVNTLAAVPRLEMLHPGVVKYFGAARLIDVPQAQR